MGIRYRIKKILGPGPGKTFSAQIRISHQAEYPGVSGGLYLLLLFLHQPAIQSKICQSIEKAYIQLILRGITRKRPAGKMEFLQQNRP
jgi:hypothetical protein